VQESLTAGSESARLLNDNSSIVASAKSQKHDVGNGATPSFSHSHSHHSQRSSNPHATCHSGSTRAALVKMETTVSKL